MLGPSLPIVYVHTYQGFAHSRHLSVHLDFSTNILQCLQLGENAHFGCFFNVDREGVIQVVIVSTHHLDNFLI